MPRTVADAVPRGVLRGLTQPVLPADAGVGLRPWRPDDHAVVVAAYADPEITYWHARTMTPDEAAAWIAHWTQRWADETGAGWAITLDGEVVGQISLRQVNHTDGLTDVSYWVLPAGRGRGAATAALSTLARWSFEALGLHRIVVHHSIRNAASCAVATKAGFLLEGTKRGDALHVDGWHDMHQHARLADDR